MKSGFEIRRNNPPSISSTRRNLLKAGGIGALMLMPGIRTAFAASQYPTRPISVIVPYAPGGQGDLFARILSDPMAALLGESVVVENRPGATGMLGTRNVVRSKADGYTLLMGQTGEIVVMPLANKAAGYDTAKDLAPVVLVGDSPLVMIAPAKAEFNTPQEAIALAKKRSGGLAYASSGTATPGHLAAAALALGTQTDMVHAPYKGAGQAMTDVIGGQVDFFFSSASAAMSHIKAGTVKAIAVASSERMPTLPDVPTISETVIPGFNYSLWGGYFVPKNTPADIVQRLNKDINTLLAQPDIRNRLEADGAIVKQNSPAEFQAFVDQEITKYRKLIDTLNITIG